MRIGLLTIAVAALLAAVAPSQPSGDATSPADTDQPLASKVAVIPLHGTIDYGLQKSLERRVAQARDEGAEVLLFEMDTLGGGLDPGAEMADHINEIKRESNGKVRTVAYVHNRAISAGALISLACQEIVMRTNATIGDCQAIMINPQTRAMEAAPEKIQTYVRVLMRKLAQSNGYPEILCEAMVDEDIEVWQVTLKDEDKPRYLTPHEIEALSELEKGDMTKTLVVGTGKLLTMSAKEAHEYGFTRATVDSRDEALALYAAPGAERPRYETNWSEELVRFLNSMAVASLLMLVGMVALYMAFKTPGFGVAEIVAISCFTVLFLSKYLVGLATTVEVMIFAVGVVLLAVEIFLIPGFGFVGIAGVLCILASLVLALQKFTIPKYSFEIDILMRNMLMVFGSLVGATLLFMIGVRFMPRTPFLRKLVLATTESVESGYVVGSMGQRDLIGKSGTALSSLRPAGRAEIGGDTMIVVADGEFIEAGDRIMVAKVRGNRVVVKKA